MKKLIFLIMLIFVVSSSLEARTLNIDGKKKDAVDVKLNINGKEVAAKEPVFVIDGVTYVPVRFVAESLNYKVVWLEETKTVEISGNKRMWFPVGKNKVNLGNGLVDTPNGVKAMLINVDGGENAKTYVPVRFLSEFMGKEVGWIQETRTVTINDSNEKVGQVVDLFGDSKDEKNNPEIKPTNKPQEQIKNDPTNKEAVKLLKLDIESQIYSTSKMNFIFDKEVNFSLNSNNTQVIITINNATAPDSYIGRVASSISNADYYTISRSNNGLVITFDKVKGNISVYKDTDKRTIVVTDAFVFDGVKTENEGNKTIIVLPNMGKIRYNKMVLENPKRIILDFFDTSLNGANYKEFDIEAGFIKKVRTSQFIPDKNYKPTDIIVRIVLDVDDNVNNPDLKIATRGNDLILTPEKSLYDYFTFRSSGSARIISLKQHAKSGYEYDKAGNKIKVQLDGTVPDGAIVYNDSLIKGLDVENNVLTIKLLRAAEINEISSNGEYVLSIKRVKTGKNSDYLIMIDPGHGGTDPGAIHAPTKAKEVDVILPVQRLLYNRLLGMGYQVIKTNDTVDSYISIYDRASMSNNFKPDVFVSLHANIADSASAKGVEILYASEAKNKAKEPGQKLFAEIMNEEIGKAIGRTTRGLKERPEIVVVGKTLAPSVLVEMGFLSNDEERALMLTNEYQEKMVQGIINAIERFLEER